MLSALRKDAAKLQCGVCPYRGRAAYWQDTQCKLYANTKVFTLFNSIQISLFLIFIAFILPLDMSLRKHTIENCYLGFKVDGA